MFFNGCNVVVAMQLLDVMYVLEQVQLLDIDVVNY